MENLYYVAIIVFLLGFIGIREYFSYHNNKRLTLENKILHAICTSLLERLEKRENNA